jgi:hypothetical protein
LATSVVERPQSRRPRATPQWVVSGGVLAVVLVAWFYVLVRTGSPAADVLRWICVLLLEVLAPGFVVVRAVRRATAPLVEDVAWAAVAGCLVGLLGWFVDRVLPVAPGPYLVGPLVIVVGLVIPATRRRVLARPAPGWGVWPSISLGAVMMVAIGWMASTGLRAYKVDPGIHGTSYYPDVMYQLDLVGELRHMLVPTYPPVDGTSLSYHWFLYAIDAHLVTHSGINVFDSSLRLAPATLVPAILLVAAVVARRLAMRVWAGPVAAALLGVIDISQASRWSTEDTSIGVLSRNWRASPPQTMGWLASLAAAGTLFAYLRRSGDDRAVPVALLVPLFVLTAGSKSSELPVITAGVALAAFVQLLRRDWVLLKRCVIALVLGLGVFEAASLTLYGSSSYGVRLQLLGVIRARMSRMFPSIRPGTGSLLHPPHYALVGIATVTLLWILPLLPRLLGLFFQVRYRVADPAGWVCFGAAVAGFGLSLLMRHPAGSEIYFMLSAYPIGVVGAASGLVLAADRCRDALDSAAARRRFGLGLAALAVAGALSAAIIAYAQSDRNPLQRATRAGGSVSQTTLAWHWWAPTVEVLVVLALLTAVAAVVVRGVRRPRGPLVWLSAVTLLLGTGLFTMTLEFHGTVTPVQGSPAAVHPPIGQLMRGGLLPTQRDAFAAGRWVDAHSASEDVVATNMYCRFDRAVRLRHLRPCDARNFVASALTQRHTLVGGWGYADRVVSSAWQLKTAYRNAPFWDQALSDQQYDAFAHPTAALLDDLYKRHHVRWIFVDLRDKPVAVAALDRLAVRRFLGPTTEVWQLRKPD